METKDILQRAMNLVQPHLDKTVDNLTEQELDYFTQHLAQDLERSLKHWEFKTIFKV